jgi:hypothetical protein
MNLKNTTNHLKQSLLARLKIHQIIATLFLTHLKLEQIKYCTYILYNAHSIYTNNYGNHCILL